MRRLRGARNGDDVGALRVQPRQRQLPHCDMLAVSQSLHGLHEAEVLLEVALGELGRHLAVVEAFKCRRVETLDGAGEEATAQRRIRNNLDACERNNINRLGV